MEGARAGDKATVSPNGNAPPGPQPPPSPKKRRKINWKVILAAVVAVVIIQQLVSHLGGGKPTSTASPASPASSGSSHAPSPKSSPSPVPTVTLNGHGVASGSGPIIVLNPGLVAPGGQVGVSGTGFDPRATVTVLLRTSGSKPGTEEATAKVAKDGSLITMFTMPANLPGTTATVVAQEGGSKAATAQLMTSSGAASASIIGKAAGKPGDTATISAAGFAPGEKVNVYWGRIGGTPATTLTADGSGSIDRAQVPVGVAPVGPTTIVLVGKKTHTMAVAAYQMLGLYPTTGTHPYALKAGNPLTFSGSGFAPGEQVLVYLNASGGTPALTATADGGGSFHISFVVPFGLKGSQTLTAIGEQSRASVSGGFDVLPYSPSAQASSYSALPGTTLSFYARGFAPGEQVTIYLGSNPGDRGQAVTAFRTDDQGNAAAAGRYVIPTGAGPTLNFTLVGQKSGGVATAKVSVGTAP
jgi:hypothetical protein